MRLIWLNLLHRLTSRKLWIAVGSFITFVSAKQYVPAAVIVATYLGIQGVADLGSGSTNPLAAIQANSASKNDESHNETIVTGSGRIRPFDEPAPAE